MPTPEELAAKLRVAVVGGADDSKQISDESVGGAQSTKEVPASRGKGPWSDLSNGVQPSRGISIKNVLPTKFARLLVPKSDAEADRDADSSQTTVLTGWHVGVLAVCLAAALAFAVFQVVRSQTRTIPLSTPSVAVSPVEHSSVPSPTPSVAMIRIHVIGAVQTQGVVSVPEGSRVIDAINAAGGMSPSAKPGELNLAAVLSDGGQVVVAGDGTTTSVVRGQGGDGAAEVGNSSSARGAKIDLNRATASQLDTLPGVGPVTVQKILERRAKRAFTRVEELKEIDGIGPKSYAQIASHVRV